MACIAFFIDCSAAGWGGVGDADWVGEVGFNMSSGRENGGWQRNLRLGGCHGKGGESIFMDPNMSFSRTNTRLPC